MRYLSGMALRGCVKPCSIRTFKFTQLISNDFDSDDDESIENAYLWINMVSNDTILEEEIRIYDNNAILGTVGGTLGLFLGFSFFSCGSFLLNSGTKVFNSIRFH